VEDGELFSLSLSSQKDSYPIWDPDYERGSGFQLVGSNDRTKFMKGRKIRTFIPSFLKEVASRAEPEDLFPKIPPRYRGTPFIKGRISSTLSDGGRGGKARNIKKKKQLAESC